jgi:hypothetical protein
MSVLLVIPLIFIICIVISYCCIFAFKESDENETDSCPHDNFYIDENGRLREKRTRRLSDITDEEEEEEMWFSADNECYRDEEWYDETLTTY